METHLISARLELCPRSLATAPDLEFGLARTPNGNQLAVLAKPGAKAIQGFEGEATEFDGCRLLACPLSPGNAQALRNHLPWLKPRPLGLATSAGMGDRLGIATPGHVRALHGCGGQVAPVFAQQSIREMRRTGRSPQQVLDDATWGIFEEGWHDGVGADADHLKTFEDIDACLAAGYTLFTIDPGEFVNDLSQEASLSELMRQVESMPAHLQPKATGLAGKTFDIEGYQLFMDEPVLLKAMAKYGRAVDQVTSMHAHLLREAGDHPFEVEVSMDETRQPTSPAEHVYIASELKRLGVGWVSFAPRFVGSFEKGVDYIGDAGEFEAHLAVHAAIARHFGPYKLSLHSGSDKFSIYRVFIQQTNGLAHLKTAGTSYLEALRTVAHLDVELFKQIYAFALEHFEADRQSYHISARLDKAPQPGEVKDWPALMEQFDAREILHVTFGSVLTGNAADGKHLFYDRFMSTLQANREAYFDNLEKHFRRHLEPFSSRRSDQED